MSVLRKTAAFKNPRPAESFSLLYSVTWQGSTILDDNTDSTSLPPSHYVLVMELGGPWSQGTSESSSCWGSQSPSSYFNLMDTWIQICFCLSFVMRTAVTGMKSIKQQGKKNMRNRTLLTWQVGRVRGGSGNGDHHWHSTSDVRETSVPRERVYLVPNWTERF